MSASIPRAKVRCVVTVPTMIAAAIIVGTVTTKVPMTCPGEPSGRQTNATVRPRHRVAGPDRVRLLAPARRDTRAGLWASPTGQNPPTRTARPADRRLPVCGDATDRAPEPRG